jgi:hypothetical protein
VSADFPLEGSFIHGRSAELLGFWFLAKRKCRSGQDYRPAQGNSRHSVTHTLKHISHKSLFVVLYRFVHRSSRCL